MSLGSRGRSPSRVLALSFLLLLLPLGALADGKMMSTTAFPANVVMPDQQALIHFTNGTERLVIETRFTGAGTNFAWVVPLPNKPVVEAATTGLFPTLRYLFQPRIIHQVPHYYVGFLVAIGFVALLYAAARAGGCWTVIILFLALALLGLLLLPALARAKGGPMGISSEGTVSILDRRIVGVFDTTTIASQDPKALQNWLRDSGFALSADTVPAIESYVKEGWVFVAAKVRRDLAGLQTSTPHPLSFTFKTTRPVYPMRLTGINNGPLRVELYVFGPERASARHFRSERCTQPVYEQPSPGWHLRAPEAVNIVHPLLRQWVDGSPVATKLTATLTPADMRQDVWLDWGRFRNTGNRLFSPAGARNLALNWGVGLFAMALFAAFLAADVSEKRRRYLGRYCVAAVVTGTSVAAIIYLFLPKIEVRLERRSWTSAEENLRIVAEELQGETNVTPNTARAFLADYVAWSVATNGPYHVPRYLVANPLLGGTMREEDSPGNYTFRELTNGLEFIGYDAQGAEHVLGSIPRQAR